MRHLEDSLTLLPVLQPHTDGQTPPGVLDVGTGAGFPGVVLAAARPDWQVGTWPKGRMQLKGGLLTDRLAGGPAGLLAEALQVH